VCRAALVGDHEVVRAPARAIPPPPPPHQGCYRVLGPGNILRRDLQSQIFRGPDGPKNSSSWGS
jgi:hypothetical protein